MWTGDVSTRHTTMSHTTPQSCGRRWNACMRTSGWIQWTTRVCSSICLAARRTRDCFTSGYFGIQSKERSTTRRRRRLKHRAYRIALTARLKVAHVEISFTHSTRWRRITSQPGQTVAIRRRQIARCFASTTIVSRAIADALWHFSCLQLLM